MADSQPSFASTSPLNGSKTSDRDVNDGAPLSSFTATVTGTEGRIDLPRDFFHPDHFFLHRSGREPEKVVTGPGPQGLSGMQYEAAEVTRALLAGETESPLVPLDGSLAVMRTLDAVRDRIGVRYPADDRA